MSRPAIAESARSSRPIERRRRASLAATAWTALALVTPLAQGHASVQAGATSSASPLAVRPSRVAIAPDGSLYAAGELLVTWRAGTDGDALAATLEARGARVLGHVDATRLMLVGVDEEGDPLDAWTRLASAPEATERTAGVRDAALASVQCVERNGAFEVGCVAEPDDTHFAAQWHLRNDGSTGGRPGADVEAPAAWGLQRGDPSVVLAVLDSGIDFDHPEFLGRTLPGYDFVNEDDDPTADLPHGVRVTGIAAANADNAFGVAGLDHRCSILPVKVVNQNGIGFTFDIVQGLEYCAAQRADVVNMSLIGAPNTTALADGLQVAHDAGCILVACAGNGGSGNADVSLPGASELTISVAATRSNDRRPTNAATGTRLDFTAPGVQLGTVASTHADTFVTSGGCSSATPIVSAIATLLLASDPLLTQDEVYELLRLGAEDQVGPAPEDTPGRDDFYGHGRVNAYRSLRALAECHPALGCVCDPGVANSTGRAAHLRVAGSALAADDELALRAEHLPPGEVGAFFMGSGQRPLFLPGAVAPLCIAGGTLVRLSPQGLVAGADGTLELAPGTSALPVVGAITAGETWTFQAWYRDGAASNVTNARAVAFR